MKARARADLIWGDEGDLMSQDNRVKMARGSQNIMRSKQNYVMAVCHLYKIERANARVEIGRTSAENRRFESI